jgi:hypothetical protein
MTTMSVTWCCVRMSSKSENSRYLRRAFPVTCSASFQVHRAVGIVSWPSQTCIVHNNELVIRNIIICHAFVLSFVLKYLQANCLVGGAPRATFPKSRSAGGRSNHQVTQTLRCDGKQHIAVCTSTLGPRCRS